MAHKDLKRPLHNIELEHHLKLLTFSNQKVSPVTKKKTIAMYGIQKDRNKSNDPTLKERFKMVPRSPYFSAPYNYPLRIHYPRFQIRFRGVSGEILCARNVGSSGLSDCLSFWRGRRLLDDGYSWAAFSH